jgi:hypothetical protein
MHSSPMREGARPEIVRDNMGHANIDVTRIVYGKSWWEERVDAVSRFALNCTCHGIPCSLLRRVPEMPHSILAWFQSIPEWVISDAADTRIP